MSVRMLFNGKCIISNYVRDRSKKTAVSTWVEQEVPVPCRVMKRESMLVAPDKATATIMIRTRIALPKHAVIFARDRIAPAGEGRLYEVIDVFQPSTARQVSHKVAICKALGNPKLEE